MDRKDLVIENMIKKIVSASNKVEETNLLARSINFEQIAEELKEIDNQLFDLYQTLVIILKGTK